MILIRLTVHTSLCGASYLPAGRVFRRMGGSLRQPQPRRSSRMTSSTKNCSVSIRRSVSSPPASLPASSPAPPETAGMGTTRASLPVYADTIYSEGIFSPDARSQPSPADFDQAARYHAYLGKNPPAQTTANRYKQVTKFTSAPYIAIQRVMGLYGGAIYQLLERHRPTFRTTFGPGGVVAKATPMGTQFGHDEEYLPFDGDDDFPLAKLVREPNPNETMGEAMARVVLQNRLTGGGPGWAVLNEFGRPVQMWPLRTPFMYPMYAATKMYPNGSWRIQPYQSPGWMSGLPITLGAGGAVLPGEDVKRFMEPHPGDDWGGGR